MRARSSALVLVLALAALAACNEAPGPAVVGVDPSQPLTTDDLVASLLSEASDPNAKDELSYSYKWFQDGTERTDLTGTTVSAATTAKGESWRVLVTPSDGELDGPSSEEEVIVLNTPPVATLSLTPEVPTTEDDIDAVVSAEDDDGDEVTYTYAWAVNGNAAASIEATLPADQTERGVVELTVTPNDGEEDGEAVVVTVDVDNTAPVVTSVLLEPSEAYETTTLEVTAEAEDSDGDEITLTYAWYVDGTVVQEGDGTTLTGELFDKHQEVHVEVTADDGFVDGDVVSSDVVTILNTMPSISQVTLDPTDIYEETEVTCVPAGWSDDDGDDEGYAYEWTVEGAVVGTDATLDGASFDKGQEVICTVTPNDGDDDGTALSSVPTTVGNTAPSIGSATLSSTAPVEGDTLSVTLNTVWDADGDSVSYTYAWYVGGSVAATSETLSSDYFAKGESVYVVVTPNDGTDDGAAVTSDTATVQNTVPEVTTLSLSPSEAYTDDTLAASVSTTDADGDSVSLSYAWYVDGTAVSATDSSLDGATWFDKDQVVYVVVTPNDGEDEGAASTSSPATILNSPPVAPEISITPESPTEDDDLVCAVDVDSSDADGDSVSYSFAWTVDGVAITGASTTTETGDTVPAGQTSSGETWSCSVTPDDGADIGDAATATAYIAGDADGDGYIASEYGGDDCDDDDAAVHPGATELCNGDDDDCDGVIDEELASCAAPAFGHPVTAIVDSSYEASLRVYYTDELGELHELYSEDGTNWSHNHLTDDLGLTEIDSEVDAWYSGVADAVVVTYRDVDDDIWVLFYPLDEATWYVLNATDLSGGPPAIGNPSGFSIATGPTRDVVAFSSSYGIDQLVLLGGASMDSWTWWNITSHSTSEDPDIWYDTTNSALRVAFNAAGALEHVYCLWDSTSSSWSAWSSPTVLDSSVTGSPVGGGNNFYYLDSSGYIKQYYQSGATWQYGSPSAATGAPAVSSTFRNFGSTASWDSRCGTEGCAHEVHSSSGDLIDVWWARSTGWDYTNITTSYSAPSPSDGIRSGFYWDLEESSNIVYHDPDGDIIRVWMSDSSLSWYNSNLTDLANGW